MAFIGATAVLIVAWGVITLIGRAMADSRGAPVVGRSLARLAGPVAAGAFLLFAAACSAHSVNAGYVGVVRTFGAITGQTGPGLVMTFPWQDLDSASIQVQKYVDGNVRAASKETQNVYASVTVNYQVSPVAIQKLYSNVGPNYVDVLIPPRVSNFFKEEIVRFSATDVLPNREAIRVAVRDKLKSELEPYSITVNDLLIDNIHFDDDFTKAIEQKQVATQNAQAEQNKVQIADAQAKQVAATAQGASDKLRIEAQGQADANRTISASLTPELIQFQAVQKLAPNIQIALVPSGQGVILDPATLLKPVATPAGPAAPPR